jgi:aminoacrylate hydrolase
MNPVSRVRLPDGAELAVTVEGEGPPLMLMSGLGGTAAFWSVVAAPLARDFQVIRFDQRGIGASSRGEAVCTIAQLAADCIAVADALGLDRLAFVGHSTGGCIGQSFARQAPERLSGLVLSATWLRPSRYMVALFGARRTILDQDPALYAAAGSLLGFAPAWLEANWAVHEAAVAKAPTGEAAKRIVRERIDALLAFDGAAAAGDIRAPKLVIGARDDVIVPAFLQEELAAALMQPRLAMLPDGGHFFPVSRTDAFLAALTPFLGEATGQPARS